MPLDDQPKESLIQLTVMLAFTLVITLLRGSCWNAPY
jgi:hypothetical protein